MVCTHSWAHCILNYAPNHSREIALAKITTDILGAKSCGDLSPSLSLTSHWHVTWLSTHALLSPGVHTPTDSAFSPTCLPFLTLLQVSLSLWLKQGLKQIVFEYLRRSILGGKKSTEGVILVEAFYKKKKKKNGSPTMFRMEL